MNREMVERPAGRPMLIRYTAMFDPNYDELDPWHSNANLIFGFGCYHCSAWIDMKWEWPDTDYDLGFTKACVEVSERAKKEGWIAIEEWRFLCRECAAKRVAV